MKFLPIVDLTNDTIHTAVCNGTLKLQGGQRCNIGMGMKPSMFAGVSQGGALYMSHWEGAGGTRAKQVARYKELRKILTTPKRRKSI